MTNAEALLVLGAGFFGGGVNALAGGGTLLTYPALLVAGLPPVLANTTSSVGLLAGYAGGSVAYRRELAGQGPRAQGLLLASVVGGLSGAVLLLLLPDGGFERVVPFLVLVACVLLALQPSVARRLAAQGRAGRHPAWMSRVAVGVAAMYGAYFGAGLGVVMLAVLGLLVAEDFQRLNALKGLLSLVINLVAVLVFVGTGNVDWLAALLVAVGAVGGAAAGVGLARRLPSSAVRAGVVGVGTVVGVVLLARSG